MDFGIGYFPTHDSAGPGTVAKLVEDHGFESLFFAEHTHIPAGSNIDPDGGPLARKYWHTYDLFVALTAAATATTRLRVGSGVCLLVERDPITTAKAVASIDHISGGRIEFGVGAGWNRPEMANHGTDPRTRMRLLGERIEAMKAIWTQDEASYHGEFVNFERIWCWPKPRQTPHPPVLMGGDGPTVGDRVLAHGDAWFPNYAPDIVERYRALQERADRPLGLHVIGVPADPKVLEELEQVGAKRAIPWVPTGGLSVVERALGEFERAIADFTGEV